jgi:hypothetical protein
LGGVIGNFDLLKSTFKVAFTLAAPEEAPTPMLITFFALAKDWESLRQLLP